MSQQQQQQQQDQQQQLPQSKVQSMIEACGTNNLVLVEQLLKEDPMYARQQCLDTGRSPLMASSYAGNLQLTKILLEDYGAPWNALDRHHKCAGDYATDAQQWDIVNLLVDFATRAELILGEIQRSQRQPHQGDTVDVPSSTKPDYLQHRLQYTEDGNALLDQDQDAVMMAWETPIMKAHASIMLQREDELMEDTDTTTKQSHSTSTTTTSSPLTVLNVGFGMGIIDTALQQQGPPAIHHIIEAHPDVYQKMIQDGWTTQKPGVQVHFGRWQDVIPKMIEAGIQVDAIFFDTYAEHAHDMEDFHRLCFSVDNNNNDTAAAGTYVDEDPTAGATTSQSPSSPSPSRPTRPRSRRLQPLLKQPNGIYTFFNGLAPDNLFFHGVACNVIKLQLSRLGLDSEFLQCQMEAPSTSSTSTTWNNVRRMYWHGRDTYYLPKITWNQEFVGRKTKADHGRSDHVVDYDRQDDTTTMTDDEMNGNGNGGANAKRQRR